MPTGVVGRCEQRFHRSPMEDGRDVVLALLAVRRMRDLDCVHAAVDTHLDHPELSVRDLDLLAVPHLWVPSEMPEHLVAVPRVLVDRLPRLAEGEPQVVRGVSVRVGRMLSRRAVHLTEPSLERSEE